MKKKQLILKMLALLACMLSSVSAMAAVEAYACHTLSNTTLTFYYDGQRASRTGTTYNLNTGDKVPAWYWDENYKSVTRVVFDPSFANARPTSTYRWFFEMTNLQSITGWAYLNTASVTNMYGMFYYCPGLTSLDLSRFNTANVTDMGYMFYKCTGLTSLDLSSFNTANVTNMHSMFSLCEGLTRVDVSNFNTANVTDMGCMFNGCSGLTSLDVSSFNTANVEYMDNMFTDCSGLTSLDVSSFSTANVTEMQSMFEGCSGLTSLDLTLFNTASVIRMYDMFKDCSNLMTIYASDRWSTAAAIWATNMFSGCTNLVGGQGTTYDPNNVGFQYAHIDGGPRNPGYFTDKNAPKAYACYTSSNTTLTFYYDKQSSSRPGTIYNLNIGAATPGWYNDQYYYQVKQVVFDPSFTNARPTSTYYWFYGMTNLLSITGIEYLNTEEVTTMYGMFENCYRLTSLDVSHFNTANVTNMRGMFYGCSGLTTLDLSSFNTANVTDMYALFDSCSGLTSLDVSSFNTANVTDMQRMFSACSGLTTLDLSSFNTAKVTNMRFMFPNCSGLKTIYVGDEWSTAAVTNSASMFYGCTNLVGGQGTTYNASHVDATYAHIDGGPSNPGYFSEFKEAYACFTESDSTLTFYYDGLRNTRAGTTYDLNEGENEPGWQTDGLYDDVSRVVFDPSFADARPTSTYEWFSSMFYLDNFVGLSYLNTSEVTTMRSMFSDCYGVLTADLSGFDTRNVSDMTAMFAFCLAEELDLSSFSTENVTNMAGMFAYCSSLKTIYVSDTWSTSNVTSSGYMFSGCTTLVGGKGTTFDENHVDKAYAHIDGGPSNPGYLTDINEAYACYTPENSTLTFYCDNQRSSRPGTTYDLNEGDTYPAWYTDGTTHLQVTAVVFDPSFADVRPTSTFRWFATMPKLLNITGMSEYLNTSQVTHMGSMFVGDYRLESLDVSNFNTSKVTNMSQMFYGCTGLTSLDLSSFNTANVTVMAYMFYNDSTLTTITVGDEWSTAAVSSSFGMFLKCKRLVGGQGTTYDADHTNAAYAHIDGGPSNPGYFTQGSKHGDVNGDGNVNISDVTSLINYLLTDNNRTSSCDVNGDGFVNISDVTTLINYLLTDSWSD